MNLVIIIAKLGMNLVVYSRRVIITLLQIGNEKIFPSSKYLLFVP
jgi:hypothetical protein